MYGPLSSNPKGSQYKFNEAVWGRATRCYLEPIKVLSNGHFALTVEETQKYVKKSLDKISQWKAYECKFTLVAQ